MPHVPDDSPRDVTPASLSGAHPKLAARLIDGKFIVGQSDAERLERWEIYEDLAQQLVAKAQKDAAKHPLHSREETLQRIKQAVGCKGWTRVADAYLVVRQHSRRVQRR